MGYIQDKNLLNYFLTEEMFNLQEHCSVIFIMFIMCLVDDLEMSLPAASPENGIKIKHAINFISYDMNTTMQMTKVYLDL